MAKVVAKRDLKKLVICSLHMFIRIGERVLKLLLTRSQKGRNIPKDEWLRRGQMTMRLWRTMMTRLYERARGREHYVTISLTGRESI